MVEAGILAQKGTRGISPVAHFMKVYVILMREKCDAFAMVGGPGLKKKNLNEKRSQNLGPTRSSGFGHEDGCCT